MYKIKSGLSFAKLAKQIDPEKKLIDSLMSKHCRGPKSGVRYLKLYADFFRISVDELVGKI